MDENGLRGMLALSVRQPWAFLLAHGHKDVENRSWPTRFRGRFLIHAGKAFDGPNRPGEWDWHDIRRPAGFDMGGIVGEAELWGCVESHGSRWFCGPYGFLVRDARPLPFLPCPGALGFFVPKPWPAGIEGRSH